MINKNLKLAIQKNGRLTEETLEFLRRSGLEFESYKQKLYSVCRNFPLDILFTRDDDIPDYVASGNVDLGIVGQNMLYEVRPRVKKLLNLRYGFCYLGVAIPKESKIESIIGLKNTKIATSFPNSTKEFFRKKRIDIEIVKINGSVEVAPAMGMAAGIVDLISTGSTLALNDLRVITRIYESEAALIQNPKASSSPAKKVLIEKLMTDLKECFLPKLINIS